MEDGPKRGDDDLERRRATLDAEIARRQSNRGEAKPSSGQSGAAGFANALRLSSEFVAGILVGAGIGYLLDTVAGTSPWGMIVFLLLGFVAGVLNVLRSAGLVAPAPSETRRPGAPAPHEDRSAGNGGDRRD